MEIPKLHYITQDLPEFSHVEQIELAVKTQMPLVQLRVKGASFSVWLEIAEKAANLVRGTSTKLIINDNAEICRLVKADGVHLGKSDMSISEARQILGESYIIGGTANNREDILQRAQEPLNYIGLGPYRFTTTKVNLSEVLGLEEMQRLLPHANNIPVLAIGGITVDDLESIRLSGFHGVAISSVINKANDRLDLISKFKSAYN